MATIDGTAGRDRLFGDREDDQFTGFGGNDYLVGGDGDDILYGDDQNLYRVDPGSVDRLRGGTGSDVLVGGGGADWLEGGSGDDILFGGFAADVVKYDTGYGYGFAPFGDGGDDILDGGGGIDRAFVIYDRAAGVSIDIGEPGRSAAITSGGAQIGSIVGVEILHFFGGAGADMASGGAFRDELVGRDGDDILLGLGGDDSLVGGAGDDFLSGGDGSDTVDYEFASAGANVDLRISRPQDTGALGRDRFVSIENLLGSRFTDRFVGGDEANRFDDRFAGDDRFASGGGDDTFYIDRSSAGARTTVTILAGAGNDRALVNGSAQYDHVLRLDAGAGNDTISLLRLGRATIDAGTGDDLVQVDATRGLYGLTLGEGQDVVRLFNAYPVPSGIRPITVNDFVVGEGGDRIDLSFWLGTALTRYRPGTNPFEDGHFRLREVGDDSFLDVDRNGGDNSYVVLIAFRNTDADDFTAANFSGFDPVVAPPATALMPGDWLL